MKKIKVREMITVKATNLLSLKNENLKKVEDLDKEESQLRHNPPKEQINRMKAMEKK